ncbi:conserved repeat domain-containing protein [Nocardia amikacinitolerans]|nr:conserved repeat domain-containing protein [Nocardia amikacinitolerans]
MTTFAPVTIQQAQFPIVESFTQDTVTNPHWQLLGSARLNGGSLELTPNANSQAGTAFLDQAFSSKLGVTIDFDYSCEGGSTLGDGFSVYVIDGEHTTQPGGIGAALGYSVTKSSQEQIVAPGVTAGFVGVGFDNYGNFATPLAGTGGGAQRPNTVGVRGPGSLREGFRWLTGVQVPGGFRAAWERGAHIQISIIGGRLTVRHADKANPNGTLLIDNFDLASTNGRAPVPETFKLGLAAGTGAATASHRIRNLTVTLPADMPLEMSGPQQAESGHRITYTIDVQNLGPNDSPDAVLEGAIPTELTDLELTCHAENGAVCGTGSVRNGLHLPIDLPKGSKATVSLSGTIDPQYEGRLTCTSMITSPTRANTAKQHSGSVTTDVEQPPVTVTPKIVGQWAQTWPEDAKGWVISYELALAAREQRVVWWEIRFDVPARTRINPQQSQWYKVVKDGTDGSVVIATPDDTHTIEPGTPLTVAVQVLYPTQHEAGDGTLRNLHATEVTSP